MFDLHDSGGRARDGVRRPLCSRIMVPAGRCSARGLAAVALLLAGCGSGPESLRSVVLVTIDTLRADYVHAYGFPQPTTPVLDGLAARGVVFDRAIAASSSTIPSHASMMTGHYPRQQSTGARNGDTRLEGQPTVAERFAAAGWRTGAFIGNVVLQRRSGLDRGFEHYDERLPQGETNRVTFERIGSDAVDAAIAWLGEQDDQRVFLWVHLQDPHGPYTPPSEWLEGIEAPDVPGDRELEVARVDRPRGAIPRYQYLEGLHRPSEYARRYAGEIAYADAALGRLLATLEARGPLALLVTSDHGESLGENDHYLQHGHASTPELARIPMLLLAPGLPHERRGELVSHVDVAPTLLELAGLDPLPAPAGLALAASLRAERALPDRTVFCDAVGESSAYRLHSYVRLTGFADSTAARAVRRLDAGDAAGLRLSGTREGADGRWVPGLDAGLLRELRAYLRDEVEVRPASLDDATLERLRELGYLGDDEAG
jgi:arylsulfatase A-like enzyme